METLALRAIHGLWGGSNLWLHRSGDAVVQVVLQGGAEKRYRLHIDNVQAIESLLEAHHLMTLVVPDRPGVPDELRPSLYVRLLDGRHRTVSKWAHDVHPDFDAICTVLDRLVKDVSGRELPVYEGRHDVSWIPEGFGSQGPDGG